MSINFAGAFIGGILTLLSPCSVMLLPSFFAYAFASPAKLLGRTGIFYLGLITTLIPLGVLAGSLGSVVATHRVALVTIAASIIIVLGIVQVLGLPLGFAGWRTDSGERTTTVSVFLLGTVYGLAGVCAGPILGAVLALAAMGGDPIIGGATLAIFALGMTMPLFALAVLWPRAPWVRSLVRPRPIAIGRWESTWTQVIGGVFSIAIGVLLIVTQGTASLGGILPAVTQAELEARWLQAAANVPDAVPLLLAVAALAGAWVVHARVRRRAK